MMQRGRGNLGKLFVALAVILLGACGTGRA